MKILVVDDEKLIRRSLQKAAQKKGHLVEVAEDGKIGLKIWKEFQPDLVFLDVLMPEMDGPTLLQMRPLEPAAKVILMSAFTGKYDSDKAQKMGADLFIPKPFEDINEVIQVAENLIK
ncbi:MAG: response regulator [Bdellovibrionaceae bacterium]|nr:response regulator [Pseudobdellovibrionaceae bacterium]|tara:strand:+ start:1436 stop:1789 length:354 start_codon:yes stop_codon:yes gene_type:complete